METIRVNMTPCEDVQTIHASQNDNEGREWGFELHNNGEKIDSSSISDQLVFKAYKGGTEEILPTNGSTPTTSPFLGDIKYPQGLLSDQEFLYRESPTEEDGLAKITDIKGNTLNWNQLIQNGNFANTSLWRTYSSTGFSVSNNVGSFTVTGSTGAIYQTNTPTYVSGHKYLVIADFYVSQQTNISVEVSGTRGQAVSVNANTWYRYSDIVAPSAQGNFSLTCGQASVQVKNVMCFDITKMGLDISSPSEFASLFSLPYYAYNQGSLLSFNGNGIKTTGKNLFDENLISQDANIVYSQIFVGDGTFEISTTVPNNGQANVFLLSGYATSGASTANNGAWNGRTRQVTSLNGYVTVATRTAGTPIINPKDYKTILYKYNGETVSYEPYTSSTLSLPISTYFSNGMKSAGNVYDELTESKAITRVGVVDLGSLTWTYANDAGHLRFVSSTISPNAKLPANNTIANAVCTKYGIVTEGNVYNNQKVGLCIISNSRAMVYDPNYTDATTFKSAMNGVYLYYELATESETSFTTASLVTENAEIPLSNNDSVLIGKCTEELSENPGFIDAKIKLADADGECYSNKFQLHIERSPQ